MTRHVRDSIGAASPFDAPHRRADHALPSTAAADFVAPTGFRTLNQATGSRLTARYSTDGRTCDDGLYVVAAGLR